MRTAMGVSNAFVTQNFHAVGSALLLLIPSYLLIMLLLFVQISGIARLALGLPTGSPYFYFSLDRPVRRLIGKTLLAIVILIVTYVAIIFGGIALAASARLLGGAAGVTMGLVALAILIVGFLTYFYGVVRLTFFLTPVVIAEEQAGLKRAWALGKGNFWRAFAVLLAICLPLVVVECAWLFGPWGPGLPPSPPIPATPEQLAAHNAALAQWNNHVMTMMFDHWYISALVFLLITVLVYGAMVGAQCFAYRAVTAQAPDERPWSSASPR
jgi:hypothetical protein